MNRTHKSFKLRAFFWPLFATVWCAAVGSGLFGLSWYASTPGEPGFRGQRWPSGSQLAIDRTRPTLLLFLHPRCPCSRSTLAELEKVLAFAGKRVTAQISVYRPRRAEDKWERTELWDRVAAIPGVRVWSDVGGVEAERFDATTSGLVLLYNPDGTLIFQGGITPLRGHEGVNAGSLAIKRILTDTSSAPLTASVFGCPLLTTPRDEAKDRLK